MSETGSQIDATDFVRGIAKDIQGEGVDFLKGAIEFLYKYLDFRELDESNLKEEARIRWKRTADQVLRDKYVYKPKSCTDLVITFQALCEAKGYAARFVKLTRAEGRGIHSMAEVELTDGWYLVDVGGRGGIRKGEFQKDEEYLGWKLWKRGRDSWDVGLDSFERISAVK